MGSDLSSTRLPKATTSPPCVDHREHEPVAEFIIQAAVLVLHHQTGVQQLRLGIPLFGHGGEQRVPCVQRSAHAESDGGGFADLPLVQIVLHGASLRLLEQLVVKTGGVPVQIQQTLPPVGGFPVAFLLRNLHPRPLGQKPHSVREREIFNVHDEVDDAAAFFTAEAIEDLFVRRDGKGAVFFVVEGTQAEQVAALPGQLHIAAHHVHDIVPGGQFIHKTLGKWHGHVSFLHGNIGYVKLYPVKGEFPLFWAEKFKKFLNICICT